MVTVCESKDNESAVEGYDFKGESSGVSGSQENTALPLLSVVNLALPGSCIPFKTGTVPSASVAWATMTIGRFTEMVVSTVETVSTGGATFLSITSMIMVSQPDR